MQLSIRSLTAAVLFATTVLVGSGCASLRPFGDKSIPAEQTSKSSQGDYQVILVSPLGKSTVYTGQVRPDLTVQGTLEESGALKKFRNMDVEMNRIIPESGKTLKMAFDFQPSKRILKFEQDYQVLPGDRIVVTAKGNAIEQLFKGNAE